MLRPASAEGGVMSEKFRLHLAALLRKNALLKRRHPCSLCCELLLAVGATGLLVMARMLTTNIKSFEMPSQVHVDQTMPVRLPDCAEYLAECSARLVEGEGHNPICVKGVTFGCKAPRSTSGRGKGVPGVWVSMGCNGTFDLGPDLPRVKCSSGRMGKPKVCHASGPPRGPPRDPPRLCTFDEEHTRIGCGYVGIAQGECEKRGCCWAKAGRPDTPSCFQRTVQQPRRLKGALDSGALLSTALAGAGMPGMRRLAADFGIAPRRGGGEAFRDWLVASGHPWASHVRLFDTAEDLQAHVSSKTYPERDLPVNKSSLLCGAVIFETPPESEEVRYTLRFNASLGYDPNVPPIARMMSATKIQTDSLVDKTKDKVPGQFNTAGIMWYTQSGFLSVQRTVDAFIEELAKHGPASSSANFSDVGGLLGAAARASSSWLGEDGRPHIVVPFPTASWKRDIFAMLMPHLLASFLLISLAYSVSRMITAVVHEREARLRDGMRMMGMHTAAFYFSWILTYMAIYTFVAFGVVMCLTVGKILPHSSTSLLFVWLMLFAAASISYALVITTFFSKAKTAATVGSVAFYASSYLVHLAQASSSPGFLRLLSLVPPVCFELAARTFADMESQGVGIKWSNADLTSENFSVLDGCCMLAVDAVVLFVVFLYLDQVVPREVGLQRPWYFPLQLSFWRELCSNPAKLASTQASANAKQAADPEVPERSALVEQDVGEAAGMMARSGQTVELRGLSKSFGDLQAVRKLDLVMYQGEIFALLGHNGAGKTTTLAMLCGLMPPSSGSCVVFGHDLAEEPQEVQRLLGVCPQHDVLWEELSCEEHLSLFARFKGVPSADIAREVAAMLQRVGLQSAGASARFAGKLSGGMKRKLSLGIAFLGGSRLVVLDEPTSGLDPYSRRMVWELLRAMKQGRVTVLSTHYMDEADILGDRIAILHEGRLMCCGSPQFLKRAYDCGYNVTFVKRPGCETEEVREAVCRHMPELASEVVTLSDSGNELILQFPFAAARHFPQVLGGLEREMTELHVESYGVSVTTLEEVFLKVASGESVERKEVADSGGESDRGAEYIELQELPSAAQKARDVRVRSPSRCGFGLQRAGEAPGGGPGNGQPPGLSGMRLAALQLRALLQKRWRYGLRDRRGLLCQLFLPSFTLLLLLMLMSAKLFYSMPALELQADHYNEHCASGPQNVVDFTHLASVDAKEAEAVLAPGRHFWRGDLRRLEPEPEEEKDLLEEKFITSRVPGFMQNVLRPALQKVAAAKKAGERNGSQAEAVKEAIPGLLKDLTRPFLKKGRRLAGEGLPKEESLLERAEARFLELAHGLWIQGVQARHAAGVALDAASPLQGPDLAAVARRLANYPQRGGPLFHFGRGGARPRPQAQAEERFDPERFLPKPHPGCAGASAVERIFWESADMDHDGQLSKEEAREAIRQWIRRADAAKHGRADSQAPVKGEDKLDVILEEALFLALDRDHDGMVGLDEYCRVGAIVRHEVGRWYSFATHFSNQILNTSSACTRYGAYFVLSPARGADAPKWTAGADAVVFVNTSSSHAAPVFQAALTNARLARLGLGKRVALKAHPFPQTQDEQHNLEKVAVFLLAIYITFCLSFIPSGIAHFVVKERQTGARQLQVLSGASTLSYWLANLTYDVALYVVPALCVPLALRQFGFDMILAGDCGKALAVVLAAFGPAVAGFSYLVAFIFKDHSKASNAILSFCLVGAIVLSTILFILAIINYNPMSEYPSACDHPTKDHPEGTCVSPMARLADRILGPIFRLVPTVCVYQALFSIALMANLQAVIPQGAMEAMMAVAGDAAPRVSLSPFAYEWAGEPLCYLCAEAVGYFALAVLLDLAMHSPRVAKLLDPACMVSRLSSSGSSSARSATVRGWRGAAEVGPPLIEAGSADASARLGDGSVEVERERAAHVSPEDVSLHVWELEKTYQPWLSLLLPRRRTAVSSSKQGSAPKRAVRGVSLAIHSGEVFGLLGHNGAGKTSALKCLVGELCCTSGRIYVGGHDMERDAGKARRRIGYCPQFDALMELLTVQDHLDLFAALKGLPRESAARAKHDFNLEKIVHRRAELLSGGNKRKLSAAIALIGGPCLAVLDEPSCGLDPAARRALWTAVHCAVAGASSAASAVLLTTHSMEEAEALSSRLGIMAEGQLLTVGTAQQIKQRHGGSHELCFTLRPESEGVLASTLQHLGNGALAPETPLDFRSVGPLLEQDASKKHAYARQRCVVRAQIEATGRVEASVLAEWWLQQSRGEAIERFLKSLLGDGVELAENFGAYWRFCLPHGGLGLPEMFRQLEEGGKELGIGEYTLTQATLEQIFNGIAHEAQDSQEGA